MYNIFLIILSLIIYDFLKKVIKYLFIKKQKNNLNELIKNSTKVFPIDLDFWDDLKK